MARDRVSSGSGDDDEAGRIGTASASAGAGAPIPWKLILGAVGAGTAASFFLEPPFIAFTFVLAYAGLSTWTQWLPQPVQAKALAARRHLLRRYRHVVVAGLVLWAGLAAAGPRDGAAGAIFDVAAMLYVAWWAFTYPSRSRLRTEAGLRRVIKPDGDVATTADAAAHVIGPWVDTVVHEPAAEQQPGLVFLVAAFCFGATIMPTAGRPAMDAVVSTIGAPFVSALWNSVTGEAASERPRSVQTQAPSPAPVYVPPTMGGGLEPDLPPLSTEQVGPCTRDDVFNRLDHAGSEVVRDAMLREWAYYGAIEIGCPAEHLDQLGHLEVVRLSQGRSDPSLLVSTPGGEAAVVFEDLVDEVYNPSRAWRRIDPRQSFGLGDYQVFYHGVGNSCSLYVRLHEQRSYRHMPPAVMEIAVPLAVQRNAVPYVQAVDKETSDSRYSIGLVQLSSGGDLVAGSTIEVTLEAAGSSASFGRLHADGAGSCSAGTQVLPSIATDMDEEASAQEP